MDELHQITPRPSRWLGAFGDLYSWRYNLNEHYAVLRDEANALYQAGRIKVVQRNLMSNSAFERYMAYDRLNADAEAGFQHHYNYEVWEGETLIGDLRDSGHLCHRNTMELLGAVSTGQDEGGGYSLTTYVQFDEVQLGVIRGLIVERPQGEPWTLIHTPPIGYVPRRWIDDIHSESEL